MFKKFDLKEMLDEIKDELPKKKKVAASKLSQTDIKRLLKSRRKGKKSG